MDNTCIEFLVAFCCYYIAEAATDLSVFESLVPCGNSKCRHPYQYCYQGIDSCERATCRNCQDDFCRDPRSPQQCSIYCNGQGKSCILETHVTVALIAILVILLAYSCGVTVLWCYSRRKGGDSKCCSGKEQKEEQDTEDPDQTNLLGTCNSIAINAGSSSSSGISEAHSGDGLSVNSMPNLPATQVVHPTESTHRTVNLRAIKTTPTNQSDVQPRTVVPNTAAYYDRPFETSNPSGM